MNRAFIFIGSNIDRKRNYLEAISRLAKLGLIAGVSSVYETTPVGGREGRDFYNGAILLDTFLGAGDLKRTLRKIEEEMGRVRTEDRNSPRTIDLDLVLYNRDRVEGPDLVLPDPLILKRPFLALTLAELEPGYVHPTDGRTLSEIARDLDSGAGGMRFEPKMTEKVRDLTQQIFAGDNSNA